MNTMKSSMKPPKKGKMEIQGRRVVAEKASSSRHCSSRQRKLDLLQDVDKLKKKLRHEESVQSALKRAFTRPLGALPRLPSYLPTYTLELLAEVAVLEEEVARLEEQVVKFRQGLYEEAVCLSSSKRVKENSSDLYDNKKDKLKSPSNIYGNESSLICDQTGNRSTRLTIERQPSKRVHCLEDSWGKENHSCTNSTKNKQSPKQSDHRVRTLARGPCKAQRSLEKHLDSSKSKLECRVENKDIAKKSSLAIPKERASEEVSSPNEISEDLLKCLTTIFLSMRAKKKRNSEIFHSLVKIHCLENNEETEFQDPYGICRKHRTRDIGPYKHLCAIEVNSVDTNPTTNLLFLLQRLKLLLGKLAIVDILGLTHHQKLAFWINIYNSCMMNAYLENGIPDSPHMVVSLMQKAMINVGGQSLNSMTIEHFILRLPHQTKSICSKDDINDNRKHNNFGLEWSEPLVTFALSCGSWSSPAVRVYSPSYVENDLEAAKKDYLQAAVGISSSNKLVIPKLLDWYLLDFAKDSESLLDWICLQLPSDLRNDAITFLEKGSREQLPQSVQVAPYEFSFRYLLHE